MNDLLKERNDGLTNLDMVWARKIMPDTYDHTRLLAMHKGRFECTQIDASLRHASRVWMVDHGYKRTFNLDWPPEGELPE